ncbi:MAG TPA: hypothetical protein VLB84_06790, partial [Bacteroidia bacterium]|nr:hypothetical protein [Bacteroidia bacterium]
VLGRLHNIEEDGSAVERYMGLFHVLPVAVQHMSVLFGEGFSDEYVKYGANSIAYLIHGLGVIAAAAFVVVWFFMLSKAKFKKILIFTLVATGAYLWTFAFWWIWLAIMTKQSSFKPM